MCERSKNLLGQRNDPIKVNLHHHYRFVKWFIKTFLKKLSIHNARIAEDTNRY